MRFAALVHVAPQSQSSSASIPARLGVAGDSAGGTLAAAICRMARDAGGPAIAFQLLLCPILDVHGESAARRELADGYFLDRETLRRDLELYVPAGAESSDPRLSPLLRRGICRPAAGLHPYRPVRSLRRRGRGLCRSAWAAGVAVHGRAHPGMIHYFYCMPRMIPYALEAMRIDRRGNPLCGASCRRCRNAAVRGGSGRN